MRPWQLDRRAFDHAPGADSFLYLAFTRFAGDGDSFVTFELNQRVGTWTNSAGSRIPCRTTGDTLVSFDDHSNGAPTDVTVERWVTDTAAANGCANTGHLEAATNLKPNVDVQAAYNDTGAVTNYLPGYFASSVPQRQFGEAALNLTTILGDLGEKCAVFGSTWMHSRSSLSVSSSMQDYVAPEAFKVRGCKATPTLTSSASGKVARRARGKHRLRRHLKLTRSLTISDTAQLLDGDDPTGTITFDLYGPNDAGCSKAPVFASTSQVTGNGAYQSGSFPVTAPGTYRWRVTYSGDDNNTGAGPTGCGDNTETTVIRPASPSLSTKAAGPVRRRRIATGGRRNPRVRKVRVHTGRAAQPTYDTATLSGGLVPSGTIKFALYGPDDATCSGTPVSTSTVTVTGDGSYNSDPYTPTAAGTYRWVADYSGDAFNSKPPPTTCGDPGETVVVKKADTTISTVASPATAPGDPITDTATLHGGSAPGGSITFALYGPNDSDCSHGAIATSTKTVSGNGDYTSDAFTGTQDGTYRWIASYSGDANNANAATPCGHGGEEVVVSPPPPTHPSLTTSPSGGATAGSPISDAAQLTGGLDATGSITFRLYGPNDSTCSGDFVIVSTAPVKGDGLYTSDTVSPTVAGSYEWVASYSGDANNAAVDSPCGTESVVVAKAQPAFNTLAPSPVTIGANVTDTATLSGADPGGKITFFLYGPDDGNCSRGAVFSAKQTVVGDGTYTSAAFDPSQAGTYRWVAIYSGDANNDAAASGCGESSETVVVSPKQPGLTTSASPPASLHRGRRVRAAGLSIYDSATLSAGFAPTGAITFELYGPGDPNCARDPIFTTATQVAGNGVYNSERFTPTESGTYHWVATYSGDANNAPTDRTACDDPNEHVDVILPANPQLISTAADAVPLGSPIHDTAHLSDASTPTGTITFRLYPPTDTNCTGTALFTSPATVDGNGDYDSGSFVPSVAGEYHWVVTYSGDAANHGAGPTACDDSAEGGVVRSPGITPVQPAFSTTSSPSTGVGAPVYDTAHLSGGIDPGGAITFRLFGPGQPDCTGNPVFTTTIEVDGNGDYRSATYVVPKAGTYRWLASYAGDAMNLPAGATVCGDNAETLSVSATPAPNPNPDVGGITAKRPKHKAKSKPRRPRKQRAPGFTG